MIIYGIKIKRIKNASEFSLKSETLKSDEEVEAALNKHHHEWINSEKYAYKYRYFHKLLERLDKSKTHYFNLMVIIDKILIIYYKLCNRANK